jgi:NAD(P)-dependent dehydrogenase (short-subunit alcohol dehydrogenase family)
MDNFRSKIAVVTGGGAGMGRELCVQLVKEGCAVATCDVMMDNLNETKALCNEVDSDIEVTLHQCDVSKEVDVNRLRDEVTVAHGNAINLVFNNAGIGGGGTMTSEETREEWERTFEVCWYGVYYTCRAFMPHVIASDEGWFVNTSSINGFWASIGPNTPHTAYSAAKFAVKGFTEALITDLRLHAPHVGASVVMPGHIGTSIAINSGQILGRSVPLEWSDDEVKEVRTGMMESSGTVAEDVMNLSDDQIREVMHQRQLDFRDKAPTSAAQAASIILNDVKAGRWRILVGDDAYRIDAKVRAKPENAYEHNFLESIFEDGDLGALVASTE